MTEKDGEKWRIKAKCYGDMVHGCSPALEAAGCPVDASGKGGAVKGIKDAVEVLVARLAAAEKRAEELEAIMNRAYIHCGRDPVLSAEIRAALSCEAPPESEAVGLLREAFQFVPPQAGGPEPMSTRLWSRIRATLSGEARESIGIVRRFRALYEAASPETLQRWVDEMEQPEAPPESEAVRLVRECRATLVHTLQCYADPDPDHAVTDGCDCLRCILEPTRDRIDAFLAFKEDTDGR